MNNTLKAFLFTKHILVNEQKRDEEVAIPHVLAALKSLFNVEITKGIDLAHRDMIRYCSMNFGECVPEPFYRGFPDSVRRLTGGQQLLDQLIHYMTTYGLNNFDEAGHSVFEKDVERKEFDEKDIPVKKFAILSEEEAVKTLLEFMDEFCASTRPLNEATQEYIKICTEDYDWFPNNIASKQTAVDLLVLTKDARYARFLKMQDFIKVIDTMIYKACNSDVKLNKVRLNSSDRKFVTKILDTILVSASYKDARDCLEKRAVWKGFLHQIHYKPKNDRAKELLEIIYNDDLLSNSGTFQWAVDSGKFTVPECAEILKEKSGNGVLLRNLNYLVHLCKDMDEIHEVIELIDAKNPIIFLQLMNYYDDYSNELRSFKFIKHGRVKVHNEKTRKWALSPDQRNFLRKELELKFKESVKGKAGKVYIAPGMEQIAVPINLSAGESGFGILPSGSLFSLPEGKKIRAFTYWEKVDDIDLSCFLVNKEGEREEFSWRHRSTDSDTPIIYSGDQTSGYNGGSEYFDIDIDKTKELYPNMEYIIFCNNVYSGVVFSNVVCRAGWMSRDILDSGAVFEPKTVESSYNITADSTYSYLFAVNLNTRKVVWLNLADARKVRVAGTTEFGWLYKYFNLCETMNLAKLFTWAATEVVEKIEDADLVVGDVETDKPQIHSYDFEKVFSILN